MRYSIPGPARRRWPVALRPAARLLAGAASAAVLAGCSFITGVPEIDRVRLDVSPSTIAANGTPATVVGQALRKDGSGISHPRRIVTFRSTNLSVATVTSANGTGVVSGVTAGTTYIVGENGGKRDSVLVTVTPPIPPDIQINPAFPRVRVGSTTTVQILPISSTGQPLTSFTLACQSSTPAVLAATASGTSCALNGLALGQAVLRVVVNGGATRDFPVIVENEQPARLVVVVRSPLREGERAPITVNLFRADGTQIPITGRTFAYQSSDNTVATVDAGGVLNALREGQATITVTGDNNVTGTQIVQVTKIPVVDVVLPQNPIFRVGAQNGLRVIAVDSLTRELSTAGRSVRYDVADPSVLTVSAGGLVTPLRVGSTRITVTVDGIARNTTAQVTVLPVGVVRVDSQRVERNPGGTFQYTATVFDSLNQRLTGRVIIWNSSNSSVVSINSTTGFAQALQPGGATITARVDRVPGFSETVIGGSEFLVFATPVARVEVSPGTATVRAGQTTVVSVIARDASDAQLFGRSVQATSSNPAVAVADGLGRVTGISGGTATITFQAVNAGNLPEGAPATLQVTVSSTAVSVRRVPTP